MCIVIVKQPERTSKTLVKMKKNALLMMAAVLMICSACSDVNIGKFSKKLKPSDNIVKKEYRQSPFTKLELDVVSKVKFVQGAADDYRVVLQAPDNYLDLFEYKVEDGELEISFARENVRIDTRQVGIVVYAPTLEKLENNGVANVRIDSLTTGQLEVDNEGVGNLQLKGLRLQTLNVESSGVGNIELQGVAERVTLECDGVGNINASELKAVAVKAESKGVGNVSCYATERLKADVNGVGSLKYGGQPEKKQLNRNGIGKISEL